MADKPKNNDKIGALWKRKSEKTQKTFLSGVIEVTDELVEKFQAALAGDKKVQVIVFANGFKEAGDNKPDYEINLSKPKGESAPKDEEVPF